MTLAPPVKKFDNGWFIEREVTRRGKTYKQWFKIKDEGIIAAALEAERQAQKAEALPPEHLTVERTAVISKVIEEVSGSYCKKVWWADRLELMQEAWLVVLAQLAKKPVKEEWFRGTVATIASRRMAQFLWECTCPATGARGGRHFQGIKRAGELELENLQPIGESRPDARLTQAEAESCIAEAREELYWRIMQLYAEALQRNKQQARKMVFEAVLRVLVDGVQSSQAAEEVGAAIEDVYAETTRLKLLIVRDPQACELLAEIKDWRADL